MAPPSGFIPPSQQVIIPSFQFNGSGNILAFHLSGICGGAEGGVQPNQGDNVSCINILQVWRPSGSNIFHIAADFTATLAVPFDRGVTTSVSVDTTVSFSSGDVLGFTPGPNTGFYFQIATPSQQQASHTYYTYDSFTTNQQVKTVGDNMPTVMASPIISVEGRVSHTRKCHNIAECVVKSGVTVIGLLQGCPNLKSSLRRPFVIVLSKYMHIYNDTMHKYTVKSV